VKPGFDGFLDGTIPPEYFNAEISAFGEVPGLKLGMSVPIFSLQFGPGGHHGSYRYTIHISNFQGTLHKG
jgi:hypothetical protein